MKQHTVLVQTVVVVLVGLTSFTLLGCGARTTPSQLTADFDVRILRDTWGVPHIFGETDADVAYGLAYAHAEDDFSTIQWVVLAARGRLASVQGSEAEQSDYRVHLLRSREYVEEKYDTDLSPDVRAVCEAYAAGLNRYADLHPEEVEEGVLPIQGKDIILGTFFQVPRFFGLDRVIAELMGPERRWEVSTGPAARIAADTTAGSNTFAVAPSRAADGVTRLCCNSHQPWAGSVTWYEVHLHSEQGWNVVGGTFPGSPVVFLGHNRHLGWSATVNRPDLIDVYVLEINPDDPNQYRFDDRWRDLEIGTAAIEVDRPGPAPRTVEREVQWSVHGPVVRSSHGTYAIRYAGMGEVRTMEQVYRMNRARTFQEWQDAMRMGAIPMFNYVYADHEGNIAYLYNGLLPVRAEGYDWQQYLPGDTSYTLWTEYLPFDRLPQMLNPSSGFVQNCNSSPFQTTVGPENPRLEDYSPTLGIEDRMTNRALRALELYGADESITEQEFLDYKYDTAYSERSQVGRMVRELIAAPPSDDPVVQEAIEVLRRWDLRTDADNEGAAIGVLGAARAARARQPGSGPSDSMALFSRAAHGLKQAHGRIAVPWGEVQRLRRGDLDLAVDGGPDVLRALNTGRPEDGRVIGNSGDCFIMFVQWDGDRVSSRSIHQYGSATLDETSPHYADQAPLFVSHETKPVWFDEADIRANLEREYRPGEEVSR
jgi:penicillin amidase/acyl-homoserine-lactone acylase